MTAADLNPLSRAVAARVRSLREQRGWSAEQLAEQLAMEGHAITRNTIANIENRRRTGVTVDELCAFADVYGIRPEQLLTGPACSVCNDAPPPGFACLNCGANTAHATA